MRFRKIILSLAFVTAAFAPASVMATTNSLTFQGVTFETMSSGDTLTLTITDALSGGTGNWTDVGFLSSFEFKEIGTITNATVTSTNTGVTWTNSDGGVSGSGTGCTAGDPSFDCFFSNPAFALTDSMTWTIQFFGTGINLDDPHLKVAFLTNLTDTTPTGDLLSQAIPPVPEPEIYAMMGIGLGVLGWLGRRKKAQEGVPA